MQTHVVVASAPEGVGVTLDRQSHHRESERLPRRIHCTAERVISPNHPHTRTRSPCNHLTIAPVLGEAISTSELGRCSSSTAPSSAEVHLHVGTIGQRLLDREERPPRRGDQRRSWRPETLGRPRAIRRLRANVTRMPWMLVPSVKWYRIIVARAVAAALRRRQLNAGGATGQVRAGAKKEARLRRGGAPPTHRPFSTRLPWGRCCHRTRHRACSTRRVSVSNANLTCQPRRFSEIVFVHSIASGLPAPPSRILQIFRGLLTMDRTTC